MAISFEAQSYFKRYQQLVLPTVTVLVVVVLTLAVVIPQSLQVIADFRVLGDLRKRVGQLAEKAVVLENLDQAELSARTREILADVPPDEDLGYFVTGVRAMLERSGASLSGVELVGATEVEASPSGQAKSELRGTSSKVAVKSTARSKQERFIPLKVGVEGDLTSLRQLLTEVNTSVPLVEMQEFGYGRSLGQNTFSGAITLHFFYSPAPASIGASDQPLPVITQMEENTYEQLAQFSEPEGVTILPQVETGQTEFIR